MRRASAQKGLYGILEFIDYLVTSMESWNLEKIEEVLNNEITFQINRVALPNLKMNQKNFCW